MRQNGVQVYSVTAAWSAKITNSYTAIGILGVSDTGLPKPGLFDGVNVVDGDVCCRYTCAGDVNLDGVVNQTDVNLISADISSYQSDPTSTAT
jgi:hypothetical protein